MIFIIKNIQILNKSKKRLTSSSYSVKFNLCRKHDELNSNYLTALQRVLVGGKDTRVGNEDGQGVA